jgi:hypothetical protein
MSVSQQLGLDGPGGGLLAQAHRWWAAGARDHPGLVVVGELAELPGWLAAAPPAARDEVLGALSGVAAADDGQAASAAAVVLVWLLAPGACLLAHRLREVSEEVDALVAGQLWIEVCTFGPARGRRVAASILWNTRNAVLREVGVGIHSEPAWAHRVALEPAHPVWEGLPAPGGGEGGPGSVELGVLLEQACAARVVDGADVELLVDLAAAAHAAAPAYRGQRRAGLMAPAAAARAAADRGVSARTVRRRAQRSVDALHRYAVTEMWA